MSQKTKIKLLRPEQVWQPRIGGWPRNRNALKNGLHTAEVRDLRSRIAAWRRRVRGVLVEVETL